MLKAAIEQIVASGLSEYKIAQRVGASQATVNRIRNGKQNAGYDLGQRIVRLRDQRCNKTAA